MGVPYSRSASSRLVFVPCYALVCLFMAFLLFFCRDVNAVGFKYVLNLPSENYISINFYNNISGDPIKDNFYEMEPDSSERGLYYSLETSYDELDVTVSFTPMTMMIASGISFTIPYHIELYSMNGGSPLEQSVIVSDAGNAVTSYDVHVNSDNSDMRGESLYYVMYYTFGSVTDGTFSEMTEEGWDSYPPGTYSSTVTVTVGPGQQ